LHVCISSSLLCFFIRTCDSSSLFLFDPFVFVSLYQPMLLLLSLTWFLHR
jgi:predicted permease